MFLFVFPVRARSLVVGLLVFNVVMGVAGDGSAAAAGAGAGTNLAYFAHLGGVFAAYVYMRMASTSPSMDQVRQRVANVPDADEPPRAIPRNPPRRERSDEVDDVVAKSKATIAKRVIAASPVAAPRRAARRRAGSGAGQDLAAGHRQPDVGRAQRARGNVEALARPRIIIAQLSRPRASRAIKQRSGKKEPPGMSRGAMPPRRSRGGDDQRIAPARCQYAPRYNTAPAKIVSTSVALLN